mmetsp:Transcript_3593/g.9799  ORF Transcript_3593/g.9799 Transcript_3593/m.9799 type:complete len:340 (+) Transcript_3593:142-1161(+)
MVSSKTLERRKDIPKLWFPFFHPSRPFGWNLGDVTFLFVCIPLAVLRVGLLVVVFVILSLLGLLFLALPHAGIARGRRLSFVHMLRRWSCKTAFRTVLFVMGVRIHVNGARHPHAHTLVCNHISYLDFFIMLAVEGPCRFVAKSGMRRAPWIGFFAEHLLGCIFVDQRVNLYEDRTRTSRPSARTIASLQTKLQAAISSGAQVEPIVLYPEGTTTNGLALIRFHTGAFVAGLPVQPVVVHYRPGRISVSWESIPLPNQIARLLLGPQVTVDVHFLPLHNPSKGEEDHPALYAHSVRHNMCQVAGVPCIDASSHDKRRYHLAIRNGDISWWEYSERHSLS